MSRATKEAIFENVDDDSLKPIKLNISAEIKTTEDKNSRTKRDVTAGEFYSGMKQSFESFVN